ncbi:MAG TPA: hypothetical protein VLF67_01695 [Candidatus Saccharimonas sp.]|nr:hypothetical protein [Candidatus Saccharimonas sp.]
MVDVVGRRVATVHRDGLLHGGNLAYMIADLHDLLETVYDASDGDLEDMYAQMWQWPVLSRLNQAIQAVLEQTPGRSKKLKRKRVKKLVKAAQDLYAAYGACEGLDLAVLQKEAGVA